MVLFGWIFLGFLATFAKARLLYDFAQRAKCLLPSNLLHDILLVEWHPDSKYRIFGPLNISWQEKQFRQLVILRETMKIYSEACNAKYDPEHYERLSKMLELLAGLECQVLPHEQVPRVNPDFDTFLRLMKRGWPFLFTQDAAFLWSSLQRNTITSMHGLILRFLPLSSSFADHALFKSALESEPGLAKNVEEVHFLCSMEYLLTFSGKLLSYRSSSETGIALQDGVAKTIEYLIHRVEPDASASLLKQITYLASIRAPGLLSLFLDAHSDTVKEMGKDSTFFCNFQTIYQHSQLCFFLLLGACKLDRKGIYELRQFPVLMENWNVRLALDICDGGVLIADQVKFWDLPESMLAMDVQRAAQGADLKAVELSQNFIQLGLSFALYHFCEIPFQQTRIDWNDETRDLWEYQGILDFFMQRHCAITGLRREPRLFIGNVGTRILPNAEMVPTVFKARRYAAFSAIRLLSNQLNAGSLVAL